jgi:hypothetical protein
LYKLPYPLLGLPIDEYQLLVTDDYAAPDKFQMALDTIPFIANLHYSLIIEKYIVALAGGFLSCRGRIGCIICLASCAACGLVCRGGSHRTGAGSVGSTRRRINFLWLC